MVFTRKQNSMRQTMTRMNKEMEWTKKGGRKVKKYWEGARSKTRKRGGKDAEESRAYVFIRCNNLWFGVIFGDYNCDYNFVELPRSLDLLRQWLPVPRSNTDIWLQINLNGDFSITKACVILFTAWGALCRNTAISQQLSYDIVDNIFLHQVNNS